MSMYIPVHTYIGREIKVMSSVCVANSKSSWSYAPGWENLHSRVGNDLEWRHIIGVGRHRGGGAVLLHCDVHPVITAFAKFELV